MNGEQAMRQARQGLEMLMQNGLVHAATAHDRVDERRAT
jgi:hypothetical protein